MNDVNITARLPRRRHARGRSRPAYLIPQDIDSLMVMFIALISEVSALRDRLDTHEALAEMGTEVTSGAVETYELTPERHAQREHNRDAMIKRVLRAISEQREITEEADL